MAKVMGSPDAAPVVFAESYRIVRSLGAEGSRHKLFQAEQTSTDRPCALRVLDAALLATPEGKRRFDELRVLRNRVRTDRLVDLQAAGVDKESGAPWFALEWVDGKTLDAYADEPLEDEDTLEVLAQVARGLGAVHAAGLTYGDLRPESVMVTEPRRRRDPLAVTLLDFWTRDWSPEGSTRVDDEALFWRAPEQLQAGAKVGPAADVWAFGLLTFRLVTGQVFWRAAEKEEGGDARKEVTADPIPKASARAEELGIEPGLSADFDRWFARCVTRNPGDRFKSADEALDALTPILEGEEEEEEEEAPPPARAPAKPGRGKAPATKASATKAPATAAAPPGGLPDWMRRSDFVVPAALVAAIVVVFAVRASMRSNQARTAAPSAAAAAAPAAPAAAQPPTLTEGGAAAVETTLRASDVGSPVWIAVAAIDPAAEAMGTRLNAIFASAGWQTHPIQHPQVRARPGVFLYAESESPPAYLETVQRALGAGGLHPSTASGYRAYYAEKRQQDPSYQGFTFDEGQTYVIVIGRGQ